MQNIRIKDKILLILFAISLILDTLLIFGTKNFIVSLLTILGSLVSVSFLFALIKMRKFDKKLIRCTKKYVYSLTFSFTFAVFLLVSLPYIIFYQSFLNVYVIQYVYLFPIILIFIFLLDLFSFTLQKDDEFYTTEDFSSERQIKKFNFSKSFVKALVVSLVISLLISLGIMHVNSFMFEAVKNVHFNLLNHGEDAISYLENVDMPDLEIYDEISKNLKDEDLNQTKMNITKIRSETEQIIKTKDLNEKEKIARLYELASRIQPKIIKLIVLKRYTEKLNEYYAYIHESKYGDEFSSLDDYERFLSAEIDKINISVLMKSYKADSESYNSNVFLLKKLNSNPSYMNFIPILIPDVTSFNFISEHSVNTPLERSLIYAFTHSDIYFETRRYIYAATVASYNVSLINENLLLTIYNNKDINETKESKIIRYMLLLECLRPFIVSERL